MELNGRTPVRSCSSWRGVRGEMHICQPRSKCYTPSTPTHILACTIACTLLLIFTNWGFREGMIRCILLSLVFDLQMFLNPEANAIRRPTLRSSHSLCLHARFFRLSRMCFTYSQVEKEPKSVQDGTEIGSLLQGGPDRFHSQILKTPQSSRVDGKRWSEIHFVQPRSKRYTTSTSTHSQMLMIACTRIQLEKLMCNDLMQNAIILSSLGQTHVSQPRSKCFTTSTPTHASLLTLHASSHCLCLHVLLCDV